MPERRAAVRVLDAVPELADEITDDRLEGARRHALAATIELSPGRWQASASDLGEPGGYGLLVVDGLMTRDILLGQTTASELVGTGDLLRPNDNEGAVSPVQFDIAWNVLEPTRLAVLDRRFAIVTARWPEVAAAIVRCAVRRSHALTYQIAVGHMTRVDSRLLVLFWHLADRWGTRDQGRHRHPAQADPPGARPDRRRPAPVGDHRAQDADRPRGARRARPTAPGSCTASRRTSTAASPSRTTG